MNKQNLNELEEIQHPYEIEYSSLKSSKNDSTKVQANKLKILNENLSLNNNNNNQKNIFKNSPNLNSINSIKSFSNNDNEISKNFRLNEKTKKNLENYIKTNKTEITKKKLNNKIKNQNKNSNKKSKNNNNIYSTVSNYWEDRDKKNKIKMQKIKKERDDKIYGELYPKPKISKNTEEIIQRLKERNFELALENEKEEEINRNIPIKTKEKNYFFKTVYYSNKIKLKSKNKNKINKSYSKINTDIKKGAKNAKLKRNKTKRNSKSYNKKKINLSVADIKNIEMIQQLRQKEANVNINEEEKQNSINKKIIKKEIKDDNKKNNEKDFINKSMNIMQIKDRNLVLDYLSNLNEIITSRKYLNEIYNRNKKIINHSFMVNSTNNPKSSIIKKINITYRNNSSLNQRMSKTFDNKNIKNRKRIKNIKNYGIYDPKSQSLRYKHYTDIPKSYIDFIKFNDNNNNNNSNNIFIQSCNKSIRLPERNKNIRLPEMNKSMRLPEINKSNTNKDKNKKNLCFVFDREMEEKKEELNQIYKKELNHKTNEINQIENELEERNLINKKLITESKIDDKDFQKIILKNDFLNNKYNELDKESLLKFREENLKKLEELRKKENKFNPSKILNFGKEEEKNNMQQNNNNINIMKYKSTLSNAHQKIENNLELYNNELKINEQKKKALLNKLFDNKHKKGISSENYGDINNNDFQFGVNKYLVNNDINKDNNINFKYLSKRDNDEADKEILNEDNEDIVENFDFERRHHF